MQPTQCIVQSSVVCQSPSWILWSQAYHQPETRVQPALSLPCVVWKSATTNLTVYCVSFTCILWLFITGIDFEFCSIQCLVCSLLRPTDIKIIKVPSVILKCLHYKSNIIVIAVFTFTPSLMMFSDIPSHCTLSLIVFPSVLSPLSVQAPRHLDINSSLGASPLLKSASRDAAEESGCSHAQEYFVHVPC